jgi:hypothetical protein
MPARIRARVLLSQDDPSWKDKSIQQWGDQDAQHVLADSPWVKSVQPERVRDLSEFERRDGGNWEAGLKPGVGLVGIFDPQIAAVMMELYRERMTPGKVTVRWESALPVRAAEMKAGEVSAPVWDGNYYAIAVYDVTPPFRWNLANELKGVAFLKREKKKDLKPERVEVFSHENGLATVVYLFSRSAEISGKDSNVRFVAQIGRLWCRSSFSPTRWSSRVSRSFDRPIVRLNLTCREMPAFPLRLWEQAEGDRARDRQTQNPGGGGSRRKRACFRSGRNGTSR